MKILLLTSEFLPVNGGIATYAREIALAATRLGGKVTVYAPDYGAPTYAEDRRQPFEVHRFSGGLHSRREFVTGDARFQVRFAGMTREMFAIEAGKEREVLLLQLALQMRRRFKIQNARLSRTHNRSLKQRRHPAVGPIAHAIHRMTAGIGQHDIGGQALAF